MKRIGVFICHCGTNIAANIDVKKVVEEAKKMPQVAFATDYQYMCSQPGQELIVKSIEESKLDRVVVAACTPRVHEPTFRKATEKGGLNPYFFEMANIREQCSWVHQGKMEEATAKAVSLVRAAVAKAAKDEALISSSIPVTRRALIVGAGIAGMQAALDIADGGYEVVLLDREPTIGGNMVKLDKTFPTLDCSA